MIGEMIFTSIKIINKQMIFFEDHFERLNKGTKYLFSNSLDFDTLKHEIEAAILLQEANYCRISVVREGYFICLKNEPVNSLPISLGTAFERKTEGLKPSYLKMAQYALQFKERRESEFDDLLSLSVSNEILEVTTSNIFILDHENILRTPELSSNVLDGILRKNILNFCVDNQIKYNIGPISVDELVKAKEVFVTNSIRGIRNVKNYEKHSFGSTEFADKLIERIGHFGEKYYE